LNYKKDNVLTMDRIKTIIAGIFAAVVVVGGLWYFTSDDDVEDNNILRAVTNDASIVITTNKLRNICASLNRENEMWAQLIQAKALQKLTATVNTIDTTLMGSADLMGLAYSSNIAISLRKEGKDRITALMATEVDKRQYERFGKAIVNISKHHGYEMHTKEYDGTKIYQISDGKTKEVMLTFAYTKGVLMGSQSALFTEDAVLQVHNSNSIAKNPSLRKLLERKGSSDGQASVIINYNNLGEIIKPELKALTASPANKIARQAEWGIMDLKIDRQNIYMSGYACNINGKGNYMRLIQNTSPVGNSFVEYLPSKTACFVSLGISDPKTFKENYALSLREQNGYNEYRMACDNISKKYGIDIETAIYSLIGNRITELRCDHSIAGRGRDEYIIAELGNEARMEDLMREWCAKSGNSPKSVKSNTNKSFSIYRIPCKNLISIFFSDLFGCETSCYVCYQGRAVFGHSEQSLLEFINSMEVGEPLSESLNYQDFKKLTASKSNIYYYGDIAYCGNEMRGILNTGNAKEWQRVEKDLRHFRGCAFQISSESENIAFTNAAIAYSKIVETDRLLTWKTPTDSTISIKPQVVKNHNTKENEVLVVDHKYRMYLFDQNGKRMFCKQLPGPVVGPITQIDYYGNDKYQYLFATDNQLHLIDRNGNYVENYPITLPAKLSADISVFDYEKNGEYRIFAPCSNRKVYLYGKDGRRNEKWTPTSTKEPVITPVQYFRIGDNDYLIFSDNLKTYVLNRRGEIKINVTDNYSKSRNSLFFTDCPGGIENARFVTTTSSGDVMYISLNGSCKSQRFRNYSAKHHFVLSDIDGDGENEYIFTDNNIMEVFKQDGSLKFKQHLEGEIGRPNIFKFSATDIRIGVPCISQNKIYLFGPNGETCSGFPLEGCTEFSICKLNSADKYSVLTGSHKNFLYNYNIH